MAKAQLSCLSKMASDAGSWRELSWECLPGVPTSALSMLPGLLIAAAHF